MAQKHPCMHACVQQPLNHAQLPHGQVEATKGALWDAFAEVAIFMEILHVQVGMASRGLFSGAHHLSA